MAVEEEKTKRRVGFWRWVWRLTAATFATFVVLIAIGIGLFRVAVPMLPDYQERIETAAAAAIGFPLKLGSIDARWRLRGPELVFDDVVVFTKDKQETLLTARKCTVALNLVNLIKQRELQFARVSISGTSIQLRRDKEGQLIFQGHALSTLGVDSSSRQGLVAWGLPNGRFDIQNFAVEYLDEMSSAKPVSIADIDLRLVIDGKYLEVEGDLQPLIDQPQRLDFSLKANGRIENPDAIQWQGYLSADQVEVDSIAPLLPADYSIKTDKPVSLSMWASARGQLIDEISLNLDVRELTLPATMSALDGSLVNDTTFYDRIAGRLSWSGEFTNWQLLGHGLYISRNGYEWPASDIDITRESNGGVDQIKFAAQYLDVADLLPIVRLAVGDEDKFDKWLDLELQGRLSETEGVIKFAEKAIVDFSIQSKFDDVAVFASQDSPGVTNLSGSVFGSMESGGVDVQGRDSVVELPGVLRSARTLDALNASVRWQFQNEEWLVAIADLDLRNEDIQIGGIIELKLPANEEHWLGDVSLTVDDLNLLQARNYFPISVIKPKVLKWLDESLLAGVGRHGRFNLKGPLNKFPFVDPVDGEFSAQIQLQDAQLHYAKNWPDATRLNAMLNFERDSVSAVLQSAQLLNLPLQNGQVSIDTFSDPKIELEGSVDAQLDDMRAYLDATPLVANWSDTWPDVQFFGPSTAQINLLISPKDLTNTQYDLAVQVHDGQFVYRDWPQKMTQLTGALNVSRKGISSNALKGEFLGQPVQIKLTPVGSQGYTTDVTLQGVATEASLATHLHSSLQKVLQGSTPWTASMRLAQRAVEPLGFVVNLQSPLSGMAMLLPTPLAKDQESTRFLDATLVVTDGEKIATEIDYGSETNIHAEFLPASFGWRMDRGEVRLGGGESTLPSTSVVRVLGNVEQLDMSQIYDFIGEFHSDNPWMEVDEVDLSVSSLMGLEQNFLATNLTMRRNQLDTRFSFEGERLSGDMIVPSDVTPDTPVIATLDTVSWTSKEEASDIDPREIPSLQVNVDNFFYDNYQLGSMQLVVEARENIVAIREFSTKAGSFTTRTTGSWSFSNEASSTFLVSELVSTDNAFNTKEFAVS